MNTSEKKALKARMKEFTAQEQASAPRYLKLAPTSVLVENVLIDEFVGNGAKDPVTITQSQLSTRLDVSIQSIRRGVLQLLASRRWEIVAGIGRTETTYTPLFLDDITADQDAK